MGTIYNDNLSHIKSQYLSALDDYQQHYILHKSMPDNNEYTSLYFSSRATLAGLNEQLFKTVKIIQTDINSLNSSIDQTQHALKSVTTTQNKLTNELNTVNGNTRAADVMITEYKELYFIQYVSNITLYLGIIGAIIIFQRVYS